MKHCHISIMTNELPFLKRKLDFLYGLFEQIIFIDYNMISKTNSDDEMFKELNVYDTNI